MLMLLDVVLDVVGTHVLSSSDVRGNNDEDALCLLFRGVTPPFLFLPEGIPVSAKLPTFSV
jgi:hypothetical protein